MVNPEAEVIHEYSSFNETASSLGVLDIAESPDHQIGFSTTHGLFRFDEKNKRLRYHRPVKTNGKKYGFSDLEIRTTYYDSLGIAWHGTYHGGLFREVPPS
jgi:hypothetical protein